MEIVINLQKKRMHYIEHFFLIYLEAAKEKYQQRNPTLATLHAENTNTLVIILLKIYHDTRKYSCAKFKCKITCVQMQCSRITFIIPDVWMVRLAEKQVYSHKNALLFQLIESFGTAMLLKDLVEITFGIESLEACSMQ